MKLRFAAAFAVSVTAASLLFGVPVRAEGNTIGANIRIAGEDVSGMTEKQAEEVIEKKLKEYGKTKITLLSGKHKVKVKAKKLKIASSDEELAQKALNYGKEGNLIARFNAVSNIKSGEGRDFAIPICGDKKAIKKYIESQKSELNYDEVDNTVAPKKGKIKYIPGKDGHTVKVKESVDAVEDFLEAGWAGEKDEVKLVTKVTKPGGDEKALKTIKDVLGTCDTDYSSSADGRKQNLANGASKIDGTILYPGESLSVAETLSPVTKEGGYALAGSYENGTTVQTYGGGICQVSSTLYNAVLRAELEVEERHPHSMLVHYLKPSKDAAIAIGNKDFRFKNNQETPIYIEGTTDGATIKFTIYGKETRPKNREVTYESKVLANYGPGEETRVDPSAPPGSRSVQQYGHSGCEAELVKIVTVDGEEKSRDVVNHSSYAATNTIVIVGPEPAPEPEPEEKADEGKKEKKDKPEKEEKAE